jgi:hypothetical protein
MAPISTRTATAIKASHAVFASQPQKVADVIERAAKQAGE